MKLNRKLVLVLSLVLSLALATGSTLAYLSDTDADVNVMTLGNVYIVQNEQQRDENGELEPFENNKVAYPAVGPVEWAEKGEGVTLNGTEYKVFTKDLKNVIDKFVTVTNTGNTDAYVRTIIAIEAPAGIPNDLIHANVSPDGLTYTQWDTVEIDGVQYDYSVFTYDEALAPKETSTPSLMQLFLDSKATNADVAKFGDTWEVLVLSQAVQANGFADAATALDTAFGKVADNVTTWMSRTADGNQMDIGSPSTDNGPDRNPDNNPPIFADVIVSTDEELKAALTADEEEIVVELAADLTYDIAAWNTDAMGGDSTKSVTIIGNGKTLTFNQTNSDWNNVVTKNGAPLTIIDAKLTNAGKNDGPWNRHDINFACDVTLSNVTSDKAMAFKAGATLNGVTISDANTSDTYAIWIQPKGQTVTLNNCTIDMLGCTDGRGLKIDEQYMSASEVKKVTLNVSNTVFKTEEKSAILVKSAAGADITLDNVDISGVAADSTNPVWVDEASSAYADLVTVTGGSKIVEP